MIKAAVLGSPISHSLSPSLHRAAYRYLGVQGSYEAIDVSATHLLDFITSLDETWTGFSLTMPLKEEIITIAEEVEPLAFAIASANTLTRSSRGWHAQTTDVNGFRSAVESHGVDAVESIIILGSGATARAAACAFDGEGRTITVIHRSAHRALAMAHAAPLSQLNFLPWGSPLPAADLLINTTPRGVADGVANGSAFGFKGIFFEALYDPWPTLLLAHAASEGLTCIDGLDLLVHQAIDQVALMTRQSVVREDIAPIMRQAGLDELLGRAESKR